MTTNPMTLSFPEKRSLGSLYTADELFPHTRKWVGEAKGTVDILCPAGRMVGVALGAFGWEALAEAKPDHLRCLKSLDFSTSQFSEKTLRATSSLVDLAEMRLDFLRFGDHDLECLVEFPALKTIWLTGTTVSDVGMDAICKLPALLHLVLKNTPITDSGISRLKGSSLHSLTLPAQISDQGLSGLHNLPSLKRLDLSNTAITSDGLQSLQSLQNLEELYLNDTAVNDAGVAYLVNLNSLKTLFLSGTKVSDNGVAHLEKMSQLRHLELRDTGVTEIAIARLRTRLPECAIFGG